MWTHTEIPHGAVFAALCRDLYLNLYLNLDLYLPLFLRLKIPMYDEKKPTMNWAQFDERLTSAGSDVEIELVESMFHVINQKLYSPFYQTSYKTWRERKNQDFSKETT